eukprot:CAMPEP_0184536894 /NCGR_PEP_ID=MMETSP0198_2-20121128/16706_1 /TAXON_ID=1112570 /ORGANISM="Thraustochytrium sp., Strain LLF1b" /LENGTH=750 /DNA_ID=CAMNT_0026930113 /DNA_START=103 /DNA_END=2355 /DNA_ORIENTATION=-
MDIRSFFGKPGAVEAKAAAKVKASEEDKSAVKEEAKPSTKTKEQAVETKIDAPKPIKAEGTDIASSPSKRKASEGGDTTNTVKDVKKAKTTAPSSGQGEAVPYEWVAKVFEKVEATTKRLEIQKLLATLFVEVLERKREDLLPVVYLCTNGVAPAHHGVEVGIGDSVLTKAIMNVSGKTKRGVQDMYEELGDLGTVAQICKTQQKTLFGRKAKPLSIQDVFGKVKEIAGLSGQDHKQKLVEKLLVSSTGPEVKYVVRLLQGKLRIGLAEQTVLIALAHALCDFHYEKQQALVEKQNDELGDGEKPIKLKWSPTSEIKDAAVVMLKQVNSELPVYDDILAASLADTEPNVMWYDQLRKTCNIAAGIPLKPMLAKPTNGVSEVLDRFQDSEFTCEYKYDGERAQIHMTTEIGPDGKPKPHFKIYSRNSENNTNKYPDIIEDIQAAFELTGENGVTSFIMDTESVAYDVEKSTLLPFQILSTRARKDVAIGDVKVKVIVCAFDLLLLNGRSLLETTLLERRTLLRQHFKEVPHKFCFATSHDGKELEEIETFLNKAVEDKCEGLMVKAIKGPESFYQPARRSLNWLKLKKDYMNGLADSLDLVPIGAYYGKGKRTGTYGAYILACYDADNDEYQSVTKIGTGFSDKVLEEFSVFFREQVVESKPRNYNCIMEPDVWLNPVQVWEVRAADLSISPVHRAANGLVDETKGIALRFPRFLRIRDDKKCEDATNSSQVADMYTSQSSVQSSSRDDDF